MKNLTLIAFIVFALLCSGSINAQQLMNYQQPKDYELPPKLIPTVRKYWVSLPKDYDKSTNRYPVLFLFDGDEAYLRNLILNTADELTRFGAMPECIIVGLIQRNRGKDFGPLYAIKDVPDSDKVNGDKFLKFLKTELLPELDKYYRTQNFRIGIGHSLGGLFLTHSFTQDPDFFNGIIAISPALELNRDSTLFANLKHTLSSKLNRPTYFCWGSGTEGVSETAFKPGSMALGKLLKEVPNKLLTYKYIDLPGKNHSLTPLFTVPDALEFVFKDWNFDLWKKTLLNNPVTPETALAARKKTIKQIYDFDTDTDQDWFLFKAASQFTDNKKYDQAVMYLKAAIQINPNDSGYYRALSKAYENSKNFDAALKSITTGLEKLDKKDDSYSYLSELYQKDKIRIETEASK
jgi:predicted alpha/beta superfamily hydrolase